MRYILLLLGIIFNSTVILSQNIVWEKNIELPVNEPFMVNFLAQSSDDGYIINYSTLDDNYILRLDENTLEVWSLKLDKKYVYPRDFSYDPVKDEISFVAIKDDNFGVGRLIWDGKVYTVTINAEGTASEKATDYKINGAMIGRELIKRTSGNNMIITEPGYYFFDEVSWNKIDGDLGNIIKNETIKYKYPLAAQDIISHPDGSVSIFMKSLSKETNDYVNSNGDFQEAPPFTQDLLLYNIDTEGKISGAVKLNESSFHTGDDPIVSSYNDNSFIVEKNLYHNTGDNIYLSVAKHDNNGVTIWNRSINEYPNSQAFTMIPTYDGGIAVGGRVSGSRNAPPYTDYDNYLVKLGPDGSLSWSIDFGTKGNDNIQKIAESGDNYIIAAGTSDKTLFLAKISDGTTKGCITDIGGGAAYDLSGAQPNPAVSSVSIQYFLPEARNIELFLTDEKGSVMAVIDKGTKESGPHTVYYNVSALAPGVYFYTLEAGNHTITKKLVVAR